MAITAVSPDLIARLKLLFREIGLDHKAQAAAVDALSGKVGALSGLTTTEKSTVVGALNELVTRIAAAESATSALIDDTSTDTDTTWSSSKIAAELAAGFADLVNGAPEALNQLNELAAAFQNNPDVITNIMTILGKVVRVDQAQAFSGAEKAQGRTNLGAASEADLTQLAANVGDVDSLALIDYTDYRDGVRT